MADDTQTGDEDKGAAFQSYDRKGVWYFSNAMFVLEDPTNMQQGNGRKMPRFEPGAYTQSEATPWAEAQWKAGVFKKFDGHPEDEGTKEVVRPVEQVKAAPATEVSAPAPAAPAAPTGESTPSATPAPSPTPAPTSAPKR